MYRVLRKQVLERASMLTLGLMLLATAAFGKTASVQSTAAGNPGIRSVWQGRVLSLHLNVLIVYAPEKDHQRSTDLARRIFKWLEPKLRGSDLDLVIVKTYSQKTALGVTTTVTNSDAFEKRPDGTWGRVVNQSLVDRLIKAGL